MTGVVVVGTGFGCYTHVRALRAAGFDVRALVGRDMTKTRTRADLFDVPVAYATLGEALSLEGVDAVTIATPPRTHAAFCREAVSAGKHVLCEKPFASNAQEARELLAAARSAGIVHLLGTEFRWDPGQAGLARAVADGLIGEPRLATWVMHVPVLVDPAAELPSWWLEASELGGWMAAHGSQLIDQIRVTLGEFVAVSASLGRIVERPGMTADDLFVVHFRLRNGTVGMMQSTASDRAILVETRVTGTRGTAWIEGVGSHVKVADGSGVRLLPEPDDLPREVAPPLPDGAVTTAYEQMITFGVEYAPYIGLASAFLSQIRGEPPGNPRPATFEDGVAQMAVLDAIRASADAGGDWTPVEND